MLLSNIVRIIINFIKMNNESEYKSKSINSILTIDTDSSTDSSCENNDINHESEYELKNYNDDDDSDQDIEAYIGEKYLLLNDVYNTNLDNKHIIPSSYTNFSNSYGLIVIGIYICVSYLILITMVIILSLILFFKTF